MVFYNGTTADFHITWDKIPYTFVAGRVYEKIAIADNGEDSVKLTDAVCMTFAHHLAMSVFNTPELDANYRRNKEGEYVGTFDRQERVYNLANLDALKARFTTPPTVHVQLSDLLTDLPAFTGEKAEVAEDDEYEEPVVSTTPVAVVKKRRRIVRRRKAKPIVKEDPQEILKEVLEEPVM